MHSRCAAPGARKVLNSGFFLELKEKGFSRRVDFFKDCIFKPVIENIVQSCPFCVSIIVSIARVNWHRDTSYCYCTPYELEQRQLLGMIFFPSTYYFKLCWVSRTYSRCHMYGPYGLRFHLKCGNYKKSSTLEAPQEMHRMKIHFSRLKIASTRVH